MGNNNPKTEHLIPTQMKKGHKKVGGRKKGTLNQTTLLKKLIYENFKHQNPLTKKTENKKIVEWVNIAWIVKAMKGDMRAIESLIDRMDGKVPNKVEGKMGVELTIEELEKMSDEELRKIAYGDP